jgi:cytochrome c
LTERSRNLAVVIASLALVFVAQMVQPVSWAQEQADKGPSSQADEGVKLTKGLDCSSCHAIDRKVVGPAYSEIAKKYAGQADAPDKLAKSVRDGGSGTWGAIAMIPHPDLKEEQLQAIVKWILSLKNVDTAPASASTKTYDYTLKDGKKVTLDFPLLVEGKGDKVTKDVFKGYELYNSYCFRCHGQDVTESELAPDLRLSMNAGASMQDFLTVAMAGREAKGMPSWAGFLTEDEVKSIYKYVKGRSLELVPVGRPPSETD